MKTIFKCVAGSRMFGVHNEHSDYDLKSVYLLPKDKRSKPPKQASINENNEEMFHFEAFINLLKEGQTIPLEMVFCQKEVVLETSELWESIIADKSKLISKNVISFYGMAREQALKYSEKGNRIQAFLAVKDFLEQKDPNCKLGFYAYEVKSLIKNAPYQNYKGEKHLVYADNITKVPDQFIVVCGVKLGFSHKVKNLVSILNKRLEVYGERSLQAFKNDSIDYKALSHCVRVAREAKELLLNHKITLPLNEEDRNLVLKIKEGRMPKEDILKLVDQELEDLSKIEQQSSLPNKPDENFLNELILRYRNGEF